MASSRWLKPVPEPGSAKEEASKAPSTPNVSMSDVRRLVQEKAARSEVSKSEPARDTPVPTEAVAPVITPVATPAPAISGEIQAGKERSDRKPFAFLDATHTASEGRIYSVMYRETISKGIRDRHFGSKELCDKTGIRSDRTVRTAVDGLISKLSIEILSNINGNPLGPRYRVYEPKDIERRRRAIGMEIDPQSKKIVTGVVAGATTPVTTGDKTYRGTGAESTPVTPVEIAGVNINRENPLLSEENRRDDDDAALAGLILNLKQAARDLTGKELSAAEHERWSELAEVLVTELKIAAARTTISSVPAFLAEHLRRRLWKKDKRELQAEASTATPAASTSNSLTAEQIKKCPDCGGSGFFYPQGYEGGVAKCKHEKLDATSAPDQA